MSTDAKVFIYSPELEIGGYPEDCPFNTKRPGKTLGTLQSTGLIDQSDRQVIPPQRLERTILETFHTPDYLDALHQAGAGELNPRSALHYGLGTPDTPMFRNMFDYVALAAGGTVTAARLIQEGKTGLVFSPAGGFHHAHPSRASGFCFLNDLVFGINTLRGFAKKILFLDIDVHHCDGVQDPFYSRSDVMTISIHESGRTLFPGTGFETEIGEGDGYGFNVNLPLPVGTYDGIYEWAFREAVLPLIHAYDPDVLMLELGMDGLSGDPLAHLHLTNNTHADVVDQLVRLHKPLLITGGGGYHVENTIRGWALCWSVLCGDQKELDAIMLGTGGVMLETTDWSGGLRDRTLLSDVGRRQEIDAEVHRVVAYIHEHTFPIHGLK